MWSFGVLSLYLLVRQRHDDAGAGAVADGVEVRFPGHLGHRAGQEAVSLLRGERPGRRPGGRCGRLW